MNLSYRSVVRITHLKARGEDLFSVGTGHCQGADQAWLCDGAEALTACPSCGCLMVWDAPARSWRTDSLDSRSLVMPHHCWHIQIGWPQPHHRGPWNESASPFRLSSPFAPWPMLCRLPQKLLKTGLTNFTSFTSSWSYVLVGQFGDWMWLSFKKESSCLSAASRKRMRGVVGIIWNYFPNLNSILTIPWQNVAFLPQWPSQASTVYTPPSDSPAQKGLWNPNVSLVTFYREEFVSFTLPDSPRWNVCIEISDHWRKSEIVDLVMGHIDLL